MSLEKFSSLLSLIHLKKATNPSIKYLTLLLSIIRYLSIAVDGSDSSLTLTLIK
jgi:hypothetical protein